MADYKPATSWPHRMSSFQCRQADLNRLVMNYLVTEGYQDSAKSFISEAYPMMDRFKIKDAMRLGQVQYAMDLATRLYPRLFETDNYIYFHMQQLRLIELIREENINKALGYVKGNHIHRVQKVAGKANLTRTTRDALNKESHGAMEPRMMFLIKLILWAQAKLERNGGTDYQKLDLGHGDFEEEFRRSFQGF
ncbi:glucose-induced degradation protein 8 homolog [Drosophila bipectinata]|uniref:glucose-induced degradation protein 8 homolog n=1 Tax=Drosophila bipectinata TaxID=42026 RepID=UPI0038B2D547